MNYQEEDYDHYRQIKNHSECKILESSMKDHEKDTVKIIRYLYVQDQKYELGKGSFGQVYQCYQDCIPPIKLALKIIRVPSKYQQIKTIQHIVSTSRQQILALIKLRQNHHIIRLQDVIRSQQTIYLVLEYCNNKDLSEYYKTLKITDQKQVRYYFNQILTAFKGLHQHSFVHRDMKPSNILVKNGVLKVADFGLARQIFEQRQSIQQHVGTMITAAPQIVFRQEYSNKCDIYSLGVILYWMLYGKYPFERVPTKEDFRDNKLRFPQNNSIKVSQSMIDLLRRMLAYQQSQRIGWNDLFDHPLFNKDNQQLFKTIDLKIHTNYIPQQRIRHTNIKIMQIDRDNQMLDCDIPRAYYKYLSEIQGQKQSFLLRKNKTNNQQINAHKQIRNQYKNQDIRLKFYKMLIFQLENFQITASNQNRIYMIIIKDLIVYGIKKYLFYKLNRINNELACISPPTIFKQSLLKQVKDKDFHKKFVEMINQKIKGSQFSKGYKLNQRKLKQKCQQYDLSQQIIYLLAQTKGGNILEINDNIVQEVINQIDSCIIQFIYFIKPWIFKMDRKNLIQKDMSRFKDAILLVHHLFMFSNQKEIFPEKYSNQFNYQTFIENQQYKNRKNFFQIKSKVLKILAKFQ